MEDRNAAQTALDLLTHRGPDAEGLYFSHRAFLGHRRLSIIDLDPRSNQPMRLGDLVISFNGEIYNYRELREYLERRGQQFHTTSDTEVLLAAYAYFGADCLQRLEGMFAFAILDERERTLFLARDRFGEKPLFYFRDDRKIVFSSEVGPIRSLIGKDCLEEDNDATGLYFLFSYIPAPYSPYRNVHQLEPGCWVKFQLDRWSTTTQRYYQLHDRSAEKVDPGYRSAVESLRAKLSSAVASRFGASDVPVATFLSGGIDSSIVTTLASQCTERNVTAYSIGFPNDPEFDESPYARAVAKRIRNVTHKLIPVTEKDLEGFVETTLSRLSEPYADASLIPTAYLCSQVEEKVILGGDGADEVFGGYGVYPAITLSARIPPFVKRLLRRFINPGNPHAINNSLLRAGALILAHLRESPIDEYLGWRQYAGIDEVHALGLGSDTLSDVRSQVDAAKTGVLRDIQVADILFNLPNDMLKKVDYASMQHSLEVRLPFLDSGLVEWVLRLPDNYKIRWRERKRLLRSALADSLPPAVMNRRKQGFLLPLRRWFRGGTWHDQLRDLFDRQSIFDRSILHQKLDSHAVGAADNSVLLWSLLVYLRWRLQ